MVRLSNSPGWSEFSRVIYMIGRESHELISLKVCIFFSGVSCRTVLA